MKKTGLIIAFIFGWALHSHTQDFLTQWDFDQDGIKDSIKYTYSGGAHCCYQLKIWTSQKNRVWDFSEYEMDGGFSNGLDNSQPEHFSIRNFDSDSAPEIFIESGTYSGSYTPYSETVLLDYENGYFGSKSFDIYDWKRDQRNIECSGENGFLGKYVSRDEYAITYVDIMKDYTVSYESRPNGVGGWEENYTGTWKIENGILTITYTNSVDSTNPTELYLLDEPKVSTFSFIEENCLLKETGVKYDNYLIKEW